MKEKTLVVQFAAPAAGAVLSFSTLGSVLLMDVITAAIGMALFGPLADAVPLNFGGILVLFAVILPFSRSFRETPQS